VSGAVREAPGGSDPLAVEALRFARTLVGRTPPAALVARYAEASRTLFPTPASDADEAIVAFACRHPWSTSLLDAACGWLRPGARLREKILVMAAVLETTPEFADEFLPRTAPPVALAARLAGLGILAAVRAAAGILLLPIATRS
jgi:hypothetical protein